MRTPLAWPMTVPAGRRGIELSFTKESELTGGVLAQHPAIAMVGALAAQSRHHTRRARTGPYRRRTERADCAFARVPTLRAAPSAAARGNT